MRFRYLILLALVPWIGAPAGSGEFGRPDLTVTETYPAANAGNVPRMPFIGAQFSQPLDPSTVPMSLLQVHGAHTGRITGMLELSADSLTLGLLPAPHFTAGELIEARILPPLAAASGDTLAEASVWSFRTQAQRGSGMFPDSLSIITGYGTVAVAAGRLNADEYIDLVAVHLNNRITVLINTGAASGRLPTYTQHHFLMGSGYSSVALADFNEDGYLDIAAADQLSNVIRIGLNLGDGVTYDWGSAPTCDHPQRLKCGDLNGDGHTDLAYPCQWSDNLNILLGNGIGGFYETGTYRLPVYPSDVGMRDLDLDGDLDLVALNRYTDPQIYLLRNTTPQASADEMFTAVCSTAVAGSQGLLIEDFDGDRYPDAIVASEDSARVAFCRLNPATLCFDDPVFYSTGGGPEDRVRNAAPLDFDGDGDLDIAVTDSDGNRWLLMQNDGAGGFAIRSVMPTAERPITPESADLDGDGIVDLIVPTRIIGTLDIFFGGDHPSAVAPDVHVSTLFLRAYPNPFRERITLTRPGAIPGDARIEICDVAGRIIRRQTLSQPLWVWDGRDQDGRMVPVGSYLLKWVAGETDQNVRILKIK